MQNALVTTFPAIRTFQLFDQNPKKRKYFTIPSTKALAII
jgi:hypothetical protein